MTAEEARTAYETKYNIRFYNWTHAFWEGTKRGELLFHQCKDCGNKMYPARLFCTACMSQNLEWVKSSGKGKIHSHSTTYEYPSPKIEKIVSAPFVIALVDLEEGVRVVTNIVECNPEDVRIGMDVEVVFRDIGEGLTLPWFKPASK